jgi:hypothetical protein
MYLFAWVTQTKNKCCETNLLKNTNYRIFHYFLFQKVFSFHINNNDDYRFFFQVTRHEIRAGSIPSKFIVVEKFAILIRQFMFNKTSIDLSTPTARLCVRRNYFLYIVKICNCINSVRNVSYEIGPQAAFLWLSLIKPMQLR